LQGYTVAWKDNTSMGLEETECKIVDSTQLSQNITHWTGYEASGQLKAQNILTS
jgi:hypothetical protein